MLLHGSLVKQWQLSYLNEFFKGKTFKLKLT